MNLLEHNCAAFPKTELKVEPIGDEDQNSLISCSKNNMSPSYLLGRGGGGGRTGGIVVLPALLYVPVTCVIFLCFACANIAVTLRRELFLQQDPRCFLTLKPFKGFLLGQRFV